MIQAEHCFDQTGNTRSGLQMPDIRLDGTQNTGLIRRTIAHQNCFQGIILDGITQRRAGTMRFDITDLLSRYLCIAQCLANHRFL